MRKIQLTIAPKAAKEAIVQGERYRFSVLTPQMIRMEYSENGVFEDRATMTVINRQFPVPEFRVIEEEEHLEIITECVHLVYDKKPFSSNGLKVELRGNFSAYDGTWSFGQIPGDLLGTARTLDNADGAVALEHGLLSKQGYSILEDGKSILMDEDGRLLPPDMNRTDYYFLGYGRDYFKCLKDFYHLSGKMPMIPRYALGNWWSRFHRYTEEEYRELVLKFEQEKVPFSVAVLDMDWHLTNVDPKYGSGWTGYTWNREYFPNPERFLKFLHKEGMHVTLNIHPADGIRAFEEMYEPMAKELGVDYEAEDKIFFDFTDEKFVQAYFKYAHHPNEDIGVDFWWVDWQQGEQSKVPGMDPLWLLNHYYYLDNGRNGKRALTFSRYAGIGSHRYPIGFSGDAHATWESLEFQPYFTANASNVGYGWWSHDIGGHMRGIKNDEMIVRWMQFGVFSPIMRIHSSDNPFFEKEPWKYNAVVSQVLKRFLRLRHKMIPYLYTMNYLASEEGRPLICPMYYENPYVEEAYQVPNQYLFGTSLLVCPITKESDKNLQMGCCKGYLPEGIYYDIFTKTVYQGGKNIEFFRDIQTIPVLAKAGAIIPFTGEGDICNATQIPKELEVFVYAGKDGEFAMYEDNDLEDFQGEMQEAFTHFEFTWAEEAGLKVYTQAEGQEFLPTERSYVFHFVGVEDTENVRVEGSRDFAFRKAYDEKEHDLTVEIGHITPEDTVEIFFDTNGEKIRENDIEQKVYEILNRAQIAYDTKDTIFKIVRENKDVLAMISRLQALELDGKLSSALLEMMIAYKP